MKVEMQGKRLIPKRARYFNTDGRVPSSNIVQVENEVKNYPQIYILQKMIPNSIVVEVRVAAVENIEMEAASTKKAVMVDKKRTSN